jgi:hypothetical protein
MPKSQIRFLNEVLRNRNERRVHVWGLVNARRAKPARPFADLPRPLGRWSRALRDCDILLLRASALDLPGERRRGERNARWQAVLMYEGSSLSSTISF